MDMTFSHRQTRKSFRFPIVFTFIALLGIVLPGFYGCTESGGNTAPDVPQDTTQLMISGNVVKAPLRYAMVNFFILNNDGSIGTSLGTTGTDSNGAFNTVLSPAPTKPFLAVSDGGRYVDEVTGDTVHLRNAEFLTAALPVGTTHATITPLTHMAAERARVLAAGGTPLAIAVNSSNIGVAQQYGLLDILGTIPGSASDTVQMRIITREARYYSLVLAGIAQEANALGVRAIDLALALATDMRDGILDGRNGANAITMPLIGGGVISLTSTMGTVDLQIAIDAFAGSAINMTNIVAFHIAGTSRPIGINTAGALYITSTVLPAWTSGQGGSAQLTATGGTPPYACSLMAGSLPAGFSLAPANCMILGTAPLLGAGITMSISAPFSVRVTDRSVPSIFAELELRITILMPKPVLIPIPGVMTDNVTGVTQVADATGSIQPLYFTHDSFAYGAHPLGTVMNQNGFLTGTPRSGTGVFNFQVCVIDGVGAKDCGMTSVTVSPAVRVFTLTVSKAGNGNGTVSSSPAGINCGGTCSATFAGDTSVTLSAVPATGSTFSGWSGACSGNASCNVLMDSSKAATATFTQVTSPPCNYTYSAWSACQSDSTQWRTVDSTSPPVCTGTPVLTQSCVYTPNTDCCDCNFDVYCTIFGAGGCWYCRNSTIISGTCQAPTGHLTSPGLCVCDPGLFQQCL